MINKPIFGESERSATHESAYLLGVGRKFSLGKKIKLSVLMLYDLNYRNNNLNQRPFVPRIGYSINF
ncbi:MAG: hypothetical protein AAF600_11950 [Bacteroidota bacterium]